MNSPILTPSALAYANLVFWRDHAASLERRRQYSLSTGEGLLCRLLEGPHHLAAHRAQVAREEYGRITERPL